jgi:sialic acid synthase SpsE/endonuclease IV
MIKDIFKEPQSNSVYVVAEIGINHNGRLETALTLIEKAAEAGVDAVKFQKRNLEKIYTRAILDDPNSQEWGMSYLLPQLKELELSTDNYHRIVEKCKALNLELIITPFDEQSADFVNTLPVAAVKIASADLVNYPLVKKCSGFGKPLLISTGMWSQPEITACAQWFAAHLDTQQYALMLANSTYPSSYEDLGLPVLSWLKGLAPSHVVGYSGHERGIFVPIAAVAYGARVIEKHITLDPSQKGPDHKASLTPGDFKTLVSNIRDIQKAIEPRKQVNQAEILAREVFAKSAIALKDLPAGTALQRSHFQFKSPGKGLFPHEVDTYIGRELKRPIATDMPISKFDFQDDLEIHEWKLPKFTREWGVKCRVHDYEQYVQCRPPLIEFHMTYDDLAKDIAKVNKDVRLVVHAPEFCNKQLLDICTDNASVVDMTLDVLQKTVDYTRRLAVRFPSKKPKIVAHLGGMSLNKLDNPFDVMLERAIRNFEKLKINPGEMDFLPECLPSNPAYFGGYWHQYGFMRAEDMKSFCDHFGLKMCFDTSHAAIYCHQYGIDLLDYARTIKPIVSHVHIADSKGLYGEGLQIGEGDVPFGKLFALLKDIDFTWVPEPWSGHLHKGQGFYTSLQKLGEWSGSL